MGRLRLDTDAPLCRRSGVSSLDELWGASSAMMRRSDSPTPYVARHPLGWRADFTENLVRQRNSSYSHGITKQSRQGRDGYPDTYAHPRGIEPGDAPRPRVGRLEYQPRRLCT